MKIHYYNNMVDIEPIISLWLLSPIGLLVMGIVIIIVVAIVLVSIIKP